MNRGFAYVEGHRYNRCITLPIVVNDIVITRVAMYQSCYLFFIGNLENIMATYECPQ